MINRDNRAAHYFDEYAAGGSSVKSTYYTIGRNLPGVLYEPEGNSWKSGLCILIMHSDISYLDFEFGPRIAAWGYRVLCANVSSGDAPLDQKILEVGQCVRFARGLPGVDTLVLLGHSGGASLMSAYQAIAENGPEIFQGPEKIVPCSDRLAGLPAADAVMFLDSNWGNGAMRLFSLDPAVTEDDNGVILDPELSLFEERNGFTPGGTSYSDAFIRKFSLQEIVAFKRNESAGPDKRLVLKELLEEAGPVRAVMVGDRFYDREAAVYCGIPFIGCLYGYSPQEVEAEPLLVRSGGELYDAVMRVLEN